MKRFPRIVSYRLHARQKLMRVIDVRFIHNVLLEWKYSNFYHNFYHIFMTSLFHIYDLLFRKNEVIIICNF